MYCVYRHTSPSGKVYIGMTKQKPEDRWQRGLGYRTQQYFYRAILKYGWENFTHEIVYENLSCEEAEDRERELISYHESFKKEFGYNLVMGGNYNKVLSEEALARLRESHNTETYKVKMIEINRRRWSSPGAHERMSERFKGEHNPMYGRKHTQATIEHLREMSRKNSHLPPKMYGKDNPMWGKHLSESAKKKISEANRGANNSRARKVTCLDTGETYPCIADAVRETGIHKDSIIRCCRGVGYTAGGYHWRYADEEVSA